MPKFIFQNSIISFEYNFLYAKIFLILYPLFENSTTRIAILYKIYDSIILGGGVVSNDKFHNISRNFKLEDVEMIKTIGTGTFARVYLCRPKAHLNR